MTGAPDHAGYLARLAHAGWQRVVEALEAADGPAWDDELPNDCSLAFVEQESGPPSVVFRFGERAFAAEAGRIVDMRRAPDGSTVARVLTPRGAVVATIPTPSPTAATLN